MDTRRLFAFVSVVVLVPLLLQVVGTDVMAYNSGFSDVPDDAWYTTYVKDAVNAGIASGYKDQYGRLTGKFGPQDSVTIAEALKMSLESAGYDENQGIGYGHWAAKYMSIALGERFEITLRNPQLNLDRIATRAEVASMIVDAFGLDHGTFIGDVYDDVDAGTTYAGAIEALTRDDVVSGDTDVHGNLTGRFRPHSPVNRAETVKIAVIARDRYGHSLPNSSRSFSRSSRSAGQCWLEECGVAPGMPNWQCPDGSIGGPSCERIPDGRCGWLIRQCPYYSSSSSRSSSRSSSFSSSHMSQTYTVTYTDTGGFAPSFVTIRLGDKIAFTNLTDAEMWVASNSHPTHTEYPEFDQQTSVGKNGKFIFTFGRVGVWGYHNHQHPSHQAVVSVDPQ